MLVGGELLEPRYCIRIASARGRNWEGITGGGGEFVRKCYMIWKRLVGFKRREIGGVMIEGGENPDPVVDTGDEREISESEIDETIEESFPASDPPSWTLGTNHNVPTKPEGDDEGN